MSGMAGRLPPWVRHSPDRSYRLSDGRVVYYDVAAGQMRVAGTGGPALGGPRGQIVQATPGGQQYVLVGLYTDPARATGAGVVLLEVGTPEQRAQAAARVAQLEWQAQSRGLTPAEAAELNDLHRALAGQTSLTLGLPGGGTYGDAVSQIIQTAPDGSQYVAVMGQQRTLGAAVTGTVPRTEAGLWALMESYRQEAIRLQAEIQSLKARIAAVEAGAPDPGPQYFLIPTAGGVR